MNYVVNHIPRDTPHNRRPALPMEPESITIHNTGNPSSRAADERAWLTNSNNGRTASYHIVIDERTAIECLPLDEVAWHAGDGGSGPGNRTSIGIELCESGDYAQTVENAVQLAAGMLRKRGWGADRLRRHYDWSGKICPRLMYSNGTWDSWRDFVERVQHELDKPLFPDVPADHWAAAAIKTVADAGIMVGYPDGTFRPDQPVTRAELAAVMAKRLELRK